MVTVEVVRESRVGAPTRLVLCWPRPGGQRGEIRLGQWATYAEANRAMTSLSFALRRGDIQPEFQGPSENDDSGRWRMWVTYLGVRLTFVDEFVGTSAQDGPLEYDCFQAALRETAIHEDPLPRARFEFLEDEVVHHVKVWLVSDDERICVAEDVDGSEGAARLVNQLRGYFGFTHPSIHVYYRGLGSYWVRVGTHARLTRVETDLGELFRYLRLLRGLAVAGPIEERPTRSTRFDREPLV